MVKTEEIEREKKAQRRILKRLGLTPEVLSELSTHRWWSLPIVDAKYVHRNKIAIAATDEHQARIKRQAGAYRAILKRCGLTRPQVRAAASVNEKVLDLLPKCVDEAIEIQWLRKELSLPAARQKRGRPTRISAPARNELREEARRRKTVGEDTDVLVWRFYERYGGRLSRSYIRRILEDTGTREGGHQASPSNQANRLRPLSDSA
jgi:hypothetical protein